MQRPCKIKRIRCDGNNVDGYACMIETLPYKFYEDIPDLFIPMLARS